MKKLMLALFAMTFITGLVRAQHQHVNRAPSSISAAEYYIMKDSQILHVTVPTEVLLEEQITFSNGVMLHPDGTYHFKNGKQNNLTEGQCFDVNGKLYDSINDLRKALKKQDKMNGKMKHKEC